nr:hypothetical protein CFP56_57412 [Quercus suber]
MLDTEGVVSRSSPYVVRTPLAYVSTEEEKLFSPYEVGIPPFYTSKEEKRFSPCEVEIIFYLSFPVAPPCDFPLFGINLV